ncbi:DUF6204 family protein [Actinomadura hibisca]|uniref:DUF6204 family protein n=1 Tax=Actinomadura hibisca TaxID=68565 RepID=UPI0008315A6F|nr:DUF6204 family protein [Actinomadura hibisca]
MTTPAPAPAPAFRVTIRGKFGDLTDPQRAALRGDADAFQIAFTEAGAFAADATLAVFSFRVQIPAEPDDDEDTAGLKALAALESYGFPHEVLRIAVTDMREIKIKRKGKRPVVR